ncbi:hypothetical protein ACVWYH_002402 [Bradyrhizobium sp. GM24.11]
MIHSSSLRNVGIVDFSSCTRNGLSTANAPQTTTPMCARSWRSLRAIISARLDRYQWFGSCIAVTGILTRMLDRLGVWNTVMKGSVSIRNSDGQSRNFAIVDEHEGRGYETGHYWLVAPPFDIVGLSLYHQRWRRGDEAFQTLAPKVVLAERTEIVKARADDVIAPTLIRSGADAEMHRALPDQKRFGAIFPPRRGVLDELVLRYVASGSTAARCSARTRQYRSQGWCACDSDLGGRCGARIRDRLRQSFSLVLISYSQVRSGVSSIKRVTAEFAWQKQTIISWFSSHSTIASLAPFLCRSCEEARSLKPWSMHLRRCA